jgi:hypothetical protein
MGLMKRLGAALFGRKWKEPTLRQGTVQWEALRRLRQQGFITQREILMLGTNHASKMITRLRRKGFIDGHRTAPNANGKGEHFVYLWSGN